MMRPASDRINLLGRATLIRKGDSHDRGYMGRELGRMRCTWIAAVLAFFAFAGLFAGQPCAADTPTLVRQTMLPLLFKEDWQASSFSADGRLLLVVDRERAFFVHVKTGLELREVILEPGEFLIWARPEPSSEAWIAFTNTAQFVRVDPRTGRSELLYYLGDEARRSTYADPIVSFELMGEHELVALISLKREEQRGGSDYRWDERRLLRLDFRSGHLVFDHPIKNEWTTNLDGRLVLNASTGQAAVFDAHSDTGVGFWSSQDGRRPSDPRAAHFICSWYADADRTVTVLPFQSGFIVFYESGRAVYLAPSEPADCDNSEGVTTGELGQRCEWQVTGPGRPLVSALPGRSADHVFLIDRELDLIGTTLTIGACSQATERFGSIAQFDAEWRLVDRLGAPRSDKERDDAFLMTWAADLGGYALIATGALVSVPTDGNRLSLIGDIVGRPTGVWEIEAEQDFLLGGQVLGPLRVFDLQSLTLRSFEYDYFERFETSFFYSRPYAVVQGLRSVVFVALDGLVSLRASGPDSTNIVRPPDQRIAVERPVGVCSAQDGSLLWVTSEGGEIIALSRSSVKEPLVEMGRVSGGEEVGYLFKVACDERGHTAVVSDSLTDKVFIVEVSEAGVRLIQELEVAGSGSSRARPSLSRDSLLLAINGSLYSRTPADGQFELAETFPNAERLVFDQNGQRLMVLGAKSSIRQIVRDQEGQVSVGEPFESLGPAGDGAFLSSGLIMLLRGGLTVDVERIGDMRPVGSLAFGGDQDWVFTDNAGRFDVNDLNANSAAHWLMPDDPLRPLQPEIFMRDYYEPDLLGRLLACREAEALDPSACGRAFRQVPDLTHLNRVQPEVSIVGVRASSPDRVLVDIQVSEVEDPTQPNGKTFTGVYDVRLFRDGQLVGQWPAPPDGVASDDRETWRQMSRIPMDEGSETATYTFKVPLAARDRGETVEFTAYAFNEDRVKSETARAEPYPVPATIPPRTPRAYVIAIGVNDYDNNGENNGRDLGFAVADAKELSASLSRLEDPVLGAAYEVVPVQLLSDFAQDGAPVLDDATKANIRAVLSLLAGDETERERLEAEVGESIDGLQMATPDDLVILTFSGHGYADPEGRFYLVPSNEGEADDISASLDQLISSDELTDWLRDVEAGEMVMIIDACHSAGSVPAGFKPGPLGDRGLGQLAYDEGMRILAATQADDVAIESGRYGNGLLSYALVEEAFEPGEGGQVNADLNGDDQVTLTEWLRFAEQRVPGLYADLREGVLKTGLVTQAISLTDTTRHAQTPTLFDFGRANRDVVVGQ